MQRIEHLRQLALHRTFCFDTFFYLFYRNYANSDRVSEYERYADAFSAAFSELPASISEGELIVGEINSPPTGRDLEEWETVYRPLATERCRLAGGGQDSHMAVDYDLLLTCGIDGIMKKIDRYMTACTREQCQFYAAAKTCLSAVVLHANRYAELAERLAEKESDETRKKELLEISEICRNVPAKPAKSFHEAVQSVHFLTYCLSLNPFRMGKQQFQLGHPDRYLLAYYRADLTGGQITREKARLLLDCLGIQINFRVPNGLSSGYMVGGRWPDGSVVANELTEILMQVVDDIRLVYPSVGLCYNSDMPERYLKQACEILSHGRSHPAVFNDDLISEGLQSYGVPKNESHDYIHSTCVEITPVASSNVWVASPYTNMPRLLLDTMTREYPDFESHIAALLDLLDRRIEENCRKQNEYRRQRAEHSVNPLLSCFVHDCLETGKDIESGGARYNWTMPSFVGMANLVDSVYVLENMVNEAKEYTVLGLKKILDSNFEGNESFRLRLLHDFPKYGNDCDEVDRYYGFFTEHIISECKKQSGFYPSGNLIPSVFCWVMHERFGRETPATPDGRVKGFPLGDGSGPCQGREMKGPTASILSSTKWDHHAFIGGVAVNMKFSKSTLGRKSLDVMQSLIAAYLRRGGFEIQINVTDRETLEKARENPEEYRDLVVRIGGYSDYFTRLSPEMQQEVILRTEHRI